MSILVRTHHTSPSKARAACLCRSELTPKLSQGESPRWLSSPPAPVWDETFSEIPRAWLDGRGRCPCIHISEGYTVMDAHHLLPWWDRGLSPTHMAMIYKKWKATLIVLPGVCISLAERLHLGPEIG